MTDTLVATLRNYAEREREHAENQRIVADLLRPQIELFAGGFIDTPAHNTYAAKMGLEHQRSAMRDEVFADELDHAADIIESLNARVRDLEERLMDGLLTRTDLEERLMTLVKTRNLLGKYMCGEPCCKDLQND